MSLILEALKKSERERRLGEAPSLGSPVMAVRRRRSKLPLLVGLIAVALAAGWWLRQAPDGTGTDDVAATASGTGPVATDAPPADAPLVTAAPAPSQEAAPGTDAATRLPQSKVPADATAGLAPDLREKVRSGELVVANPQLLKPGQPAVIKESEPSTPGPATVPPTQAPATVDAPRAAAAVPPAPESTVPAATPPAPAAAVDAPAAATATTTGPATPVIWELPHAQRREIPELKVTMHVFAAEPAQRFVIVNDERRVQGEDVDGLTITEIRQDGIVFTGKSGLRFLLPRGGR